MRSKSLGRASFDSGDWFDATHGNRADGNGFGRGLPPAAGADRVVRTVTYTKSTGTFEVPGRTVAVFTR
ncbi:hypothetical protein [Streptomyces fumanus]|uniref:Uncharacterized protein n=1 Tax=Streptomyces fumanus TaxID=67302 RepID=A0A919DZY8_9ACTN|nr:hypothetical protein [Streptomyces fumanus]GHE97926.1 hypothetical protein GCM10018772_22880 [Streptomyces fumanus]